MRFLIVTGLSGAGKTSILRHLEDNGYQCMDNIPPLLLAPAFTLCEKVEVDTPVALGVDSRSGALFNAEAVINAIDQSGDSHDISILFLEADTETLIDRYKETRRDHPLMKNGTSLERAIAKEREMLQPLRERANYVLSTGGLRPKELCARVDELLADGENQATLRTEIMSFGYKRGIPRESDLVFDVRFLPNPFYIKEIRAYTGLEAPVRDYVLGKEETREFLSHLYELVDYLLPLYQREGKRRLMIAIGCTGGAHRSVAISEALGAHLRALGQPVRRIPPRHHAGRSELALQTGEITRNDGALPHAPAGNRRSLHPFSASRRFQDAESNDALRASSDCRQKAILPPKGGEIALSANESIAEFLDFAYVNLNCRAPAVRDSRRQTSQGCLREYVSLPSRKSRATPPYNSISKRAC